MAYTTDDKHFRRLAEAVDDNYRLDLPARELHQTLIRFIMGDLYPTQQGSPGPLTAIALLNMYSRAILRHQISRDPRLLATTAVPWLKPWSENQELASNKAIQQSNAAEVLHECARQANVSFGTLFMAPQYVGVPGGMKLELGLEALDRCEVVYDRDSRSLERADFIGHRMRMKLIDIFENPLFDERCRIEVEADGQAPGPENETNNLIKGQSRRTGLYDYATVWCVYDRPRNKLVYFAKEQPTMRLAEIDWEGPREGPYLFHYYNRPPGHALPISPLQEVLTLHDGFNVLAMKAIHQQQVEKGLLKYTNAAKGDAERVVNAAENQSVLQENGMVAWTHIGGAAPDTVAMKEKLRMDFSYATGGVIDQFAQQADTLGQERLTRGAANEALEDMSGATYAFAKRFCRNFYWFNVRDPNPKPEMLTKPTGVPDIFYQTPWTREHRQMVQDFEFEVDVEPYSYVDRSPQAKLADLLGGLQIVMGMMDQAMLQGISLDVDGIVRQIGKLKNIPELYDCLILNQEPERIYAMLGPRTGSSQSAQNPAKPNGQYTRRSESDGSGADVETMRMFGRAPQNEVMVA